MPVTLEAVGDELQYGSLDEGALAVHGFHGSGEAQEENEEEAPQATEPPEVDTPLTEIPATSMGSMDGEDSVQEPATPAPKRRGRPPKEAPVQEPATPAPKRRGRPPKTQAQVPVPKAKPIAKRVPKRVAPPPPSDSESDSSSDSPTASLHRDDIETMMLSYLVQRKHQQIDKRRQMWTRLAGLS